MRTTSSHRLSWSIWSEQSLSVVKSPIVGFGIDPSRRSIVPSLNWIFAMYLPLVVAGTDVEIIDVV